MKLKGWLLLGGIGLVGRYAIKQLSHAPLPPLTIENSVVLITGASSGIGRAYAMAFAKRGARVVIAARRQELLEEVRREIEPYAASVLVTPTDVSDNDQLQVLVSTVREYFGRIDVLVNNAGVPLGGPLHTIPQKVILNTIDVNLTAGIMLTNLVLPMMLAQRSGRIVNVSSILGGIAIPYFSVYAVTKHGLMAFAKTLRRELDGTGVGIVSVMPTWTSTDMLSAETQQSMLESGSGVDSPDFVAERTIEGLLRGETDIYFGGAQMRMGHFLERHFPTLMDLYFRLTTTPNTIATRRGN